MFDIISVVMKIANLLDELLWKIQQYQYFGMYGVSVLRKIALALGVSANQLLGITREQVGKVSEHEQRG